MAHVIDLTGKRFERLVVVRRATISIGGKPRWECQCDCGTTSIVWGYRLRRGNTKSCGCLRRDISRRVNTTHGLRNTPEYEAWSSMMQRCPNPRKRNFCDYGGRGIKVCLRWAKFSNFILDMGLRPSPAHTIERVNNDGDYEPDNCCWATRSEQMRNQRPKKLSHHQVRAIRLLSGSISQRKIAALFGVSQSSVSFIVTGTTHQQVQS